MEDITKKHFGLFFPDTLYFSCMSLFTRLYSLNVNSTTWKMLVLCSETATIGLSRIGRVEPDQYFAWDRRVSSSRIRNLADRVGSGCM